MLKLKKDKPSDICVADMKDGDIAVITKWSCGGYIGYIIQRYKDFLITVGSRSGKGWGEYFKPGDTFKRSEDCRVRLLEPGEELIVG